MRIQIRSHLLMYRSRMAQRLLDAFFEVFTVCSCVHVANAAATSLSVTSANWTRCLELDEAYINTTIQNILSNFVVFFLDSSGLPYRRERFAVADFWQLFWAIRGGLFEGIND